MEKEAITPQVEEIPGEVAQLKELVNVLLSKDKEREKEIEELNRKMTESAFQHARDMETIKGLQSFLNLHIQAKKDEIEGNGMEPESDSLDPPSPISTGQSSSSCSSQGDSAEVVSDDSRTKSKIKNEIKVRAPVQATSSSINHQPSSAPNNAAPAPLDMNKEMLDNVKKCKNFLSTLLKLAPSHSTETVKNVQALTQGLIDGRVEPEAFTERLQHELQSSPQPYLVPFLKRSLPLLRQCMQQGRMTIEGVNPPPVGGASLAAIGPRKKRKFDLGDSTTSEVDPVRVMYCSASLNLSVLFMSLMLFGRLFHSRKVFGKNECGGHETYTSYIPDMMMIHLTQSTNCMVTVTIELGHQANLLKEQRLCGFTHDWTVFVRGFEENEIQHFVEKVVFKLHKTYTTPTRVISEPPYKVTECGYAGFYLPIEIHFKNKQTPRKIPFAYDMFLNASDTPPINNIRYEKLKFRNPTPEFKARLIRAGGIEQGLDGLPVQHPEPELEGSPPKNVIERKSSTGSDVQASTSNTSRIMRPRIKRVN